MLHLGSLFIATKGIKQQFVVKHRFIVHVGLFSGDLTVKISTVKEASRFTFICQDKQRKINPPWRNIFL